MKRLWLILPLLAGCEKADEGRFTGYVEAQAAAVAAPQSGWLSAVYVDDGASVALDQPLFALDATQARQALTGAESHEAAARATAQDMSKGAREADIAPLLKERDQAQASLDLARSEEARYGKLAASGYAAPAKMDSLRATRKAAEASVAAIDRQIAAQRQAGRADQLVAAQAQAEGAAADTAQAQWTVDERAVRARLQGRVGQRLREPGEYVAVGQPVLSLYVTGREFVRFYVPQGELARVKIGQSVRVTCDGCAAQTAKVRYIATEAEFTPPVIYSVRERQKLVYLIEATPEKPDALRPGQPVDVTL
ncbi:HlyD family efflux transporter periplasmic adaptor subunit [Asticcacaulis sp. BYS171W]|uniref:HlyD family efflux transporter periplasmic adaptor subunit n=1 Tax=Asticcacaulis aquaticus TaxID=2984212 RepID=A0ABT5HUU6_9CAUL|nr:HlyD family efflux transporter periplasmic adaptor subunit [Asticcacaulis aquaticus]MDC7683723.1 HlyD family efflux transporter periplasmic adaptor subunit [Asticcacaulis aquaticus]